MKVIVISPPETFRGEQLLANNMLAEGLDYFHIRKPALSSGEMVDYLKQIDPRFYRKIVIHSHYEIIGKYNIGGLHFPSHYVKRANPDELKKTISEAKKRKLRTGTSAHLVEEAATVKELDYFFLGPLFESISKEGYKGAIELNAAQEYLSMRNASYPEAIALGGINLGNIYLLKGRGFNGIAILGAIWKDFDATKIGERLEILKDIQKQVREILY